MTGEALQVRNWVLEKSKDSKRNMRPSEQRLELTLDAQTMTGS